MLEDRLLSFLYYTGVLENRGNIKTSKKTKGYITDIVTQYEKSESPVTFKIKNITGKRYYIFSN